MSAIRLFLVTFAATASLAFSQSIPPVVYSVDAFDPAGTRGFSYSNGQIGGVWSNWFGSAFQSVTWDSAVDANSSSTSGSMKILANFPGSGSNQFTIINGFNGISPSINARQFTALECDVKFAPGSATMLKNGVSIFGSLQFGMATPSFGQDYFPGSVDVPATNTGWVHVSIPLDPATDANLYKITNVLVHIWGGTSLSGASTLWVDNLKFTGTTVTDTATVNYATARQQIDGFGASSAWGSTWSAAEADLFFSTGPGGVGLSLLRSRIAPNGTTVESGIMQMAQARGAKVWSAPWSPPASYKDSNNVNGGNFISSTANYQNYASQLANYVASMKTTYGINLDAVSVQNEPDASTTYESCVWTSAQIHEFVPYLSEALAVRNVGSTRILLPESMHWQFSLAADTMADPATAAKVGILGGHNYGSSATAVTQFGSPPPVRLWETEHYIETGGDTITNGLALAREIHEFMTIAEANAYHYWWLKGSGTGSIAGTSTTNPAKRLYVMGNYSKFVRPGFQRVTVGSNTTALISAYKNPATSDFVIVAANPTAWPVTQTFDLSSCPSVTSLDRWVTSDTLSLSGQAAVNVAASRFTTELAPYSVTTFVSVAASSPVIVMKASDAVGSTSFNAVGNWNDTTAPSATKDYSTAQYVLRTPSAGGNQVFAGHSLTVPPLGVLRFKGGNNDTITVSNLTLDGGSIENGNGNTTFTLAGSVSVKADSIVDPSGDSTRTIQIASEMEGTGSLTCGNGGVGTVVLSGNNNSYTGAVTVNGGCVLKIGALSNLGGNPGTFNASQLVLSNGVLQPTAGFQMNHANSGIHLDAGGGTFSINSGLELTIGNPVGGPGGLVKSGAGSVVMNGADSHAGTTTVSAGSLTTSGLSGTGAVSVAGGATFGGSGTIAGNTTINGTLAPSPAGLVFNGNLVFNSTARVQWELSANSMAADRASGATVSVAAGAKIDLVLNSPGSTTNFLHGFWRAPRSFPVIAASAMTGSFTLGSLTPDSGGRPVATYGTFSLQNSASGTNLVWTPIPGFPSVDDPTLVLTSPSQDAVSLPSNALSLRLTVSVTGGVGTTIAWSQVSGPGLASFADSSAADTRVSFPEDGTYVLRCTAANQIGSVSREITVHVAPTTSLTLREGVASYAHAGTFIRGDNPTMNSGVRDQMIVGRNGGALRGLLSFDLSRIPVGAAIHSVTLDLWSVSAGSGTSLNPLEAHNLLTTFIEGGGDGSSAANGAGTGADWPTRTGNNADPWTSPGGGSGTDYDAALLAAIPGFNPSTSPVGTHYSFGSTPALVSAVSGIAGTAAPLGLMIKMAGDTSGGNTFVRFGSDDHSNLSQRPQLTIGYSLNQVPAVSPGSAPAAETGVAALLVGSTTDATGSIWTLVGGPGNAIFGNASQASTTVTFNLPGTYLLRLSANNPIGESSSTLAVNVLDLTPPSVVVPADMTVSATGAAGAAVSFSTSAVDAVDGAIPTVNTPAPGSSFPVGTTTVTAAASDLAGNAASRTFTVTVMAGSFNSWAVGNFTAAELSNPSISGPNATPAGDSLTNLMKYALGLPPKTPSVTGIMLEKSQGNWHLTYSRPAYRPDISYAVEITTDPGGAWTTDGVTHTRIASGDPEIWRAEATAVPKGALFLRLKVVRP